MGIVGSCLRSERRLLDLMEVGFETRCSTTFILGGSIPCGEGSTSKCCTLSTMWPAWREPRWPQYAVAAHAEDEVQRVIFHFPL